MTYTQPVDYRGMPPQGKANSGMAIASLIIGAVALLLAWVPCVNFLALLLALLGLILGIVAWVSAAKVPGQKPTMAIIGIVLSVLAVPSFFLSWMLLGGALERGAGSLVQYGLTTGANAEADAIAAQARARGVDENTIADARAKLDETLSTVTSNVSDAERASRDVEAALEEFRSTLEAAAGTDLPGTDDPDQNSTDPGDGGGE